MIIRIWSIAFILNAVWELLHARLYTVGGLPVELLRLFQSMFFDAWIVLGLYALFAFFFQNKEWYRHAKVKHLILLAFIGGLIAISVETHAVYIAHRWEYHSIMPTVMGIGLSPLLQMMILPPLTMALAAKFKGK